MSKKNKGGKKISPKTAAAVKNKNTQQKPAATAENNKPEEKPQDKKPEEKKNSQASATPKGNANKKAITEPPKDNTASIENGGVSVEKPGEKKQEKTSVYTPDDATKGLQYALAHGTGDHMSSDSQVLLLDLARRAFVEEKRTEFTVPTEVAQKMNLVINAGIVAKFAEAAISGETAFDVVIKSAAYPQLAEVAKSMGVTLPSIKAIEAHTSTANKKQGNIQVPAGKGSGTKVSAEAEKQIKKDQEVRNNPPELDPTKISSEDDLKKALTYILTIKGETVGKVLVDVVDFMRNYRMNEASKAENSTEAMEKLDQRTTAAWLDDIFQYVHPSFVFGGIGKGMSLTVDSTGSPIRAYTILYESIKQGSKEEQIPWDDQSIADAVTCIIRWVTTDGINADKKNLEALGDPKKYDNQTKEIAEKYKESIKKGEERISSILSPDSSFLTTFLDKKNAHDKNAVTLYSMIRRLYYPDTLTDENKDKKYKNLDSLIMNRIGYIFNLFRAADSKIEGYSADDLGTPEAYTDEEIKAQKKAEGEAKKEAKAAKK